MLRIIALLIIGICYTSALHELTIVSIPDSVAEDAPAGGGRVVGGSPTPIGIYPYAVQVVQSNRLICGGSLLTPRHVLSAAHCFLDSQNVLLSASLFSCRVGSTVLNAGGSVHRVSQIINHERYNLDAARDNDISVLLLRTTVSLGALVDLAAIPDGGIVPDTSQLWIVGWGRFMPQDEQASSLLQSTSVYQINREVCAQRYRELEVINNAPYPVTDNMMCSGMLDNIGGRGACDGDDGGPVVYMDIVVGVSSWREQCGHPYYPGVSVRVAAYTDWINDTVTRYNGAPSLERTSVVLLLCSCLIVTIFSNKL